MTVDDSRIRALSFWWSLPLAPAYQPEFPLWMITVCDLVSLISTLISLIAIVRPKYPIGQGIHLEGRFLTSEIRFGAFSFSRDVSIHRMLCKPQRLPSCHPNNEHCWSTRQIVFGLQSPKWPRYHCHFLSHLVYFCASDFIMWFSFNVSPICCSVPRASTL